MDSALVVLSGMDIRGETVAETVYTDLSGDYLFFGLLPPYQASSGYTITPSRSSPSYPAASSVISPMDAVKALMHDVHLDTLVGDYFVAGEVSGNGRVSSYDAALILSQVVGYSTTDPFPVSGGDPLLDFAFRPAFASPGDFDTMSITITSLDSNSVGNDFVGLAYGDITASWVQNPGVTKPVVGTSRTVRLGALSEPNHLTVLIDDASNIYSGYLEIEIDPHAWQVLSVERGDLTTDTELVYNMREGKLVVAFAGAKALQGSGSLLEIQLQVRGDQDTPVSLVQVVFDEGRIPAVVEGAVVRSPGIPTVYRLEQNIPNPFNPETEICYSLPEAGHVRLVIYNLLGQQVRVLVEGFQPAGFHSVAWDGRDNQGRLVSSGIYLYRLTAGDFAQTKRMILLR